MQTPALDNQLVFCPSVDNNNIFLAVQPSRYQKKKKVYWSTKLVGRALSLNICFSSSLPPPRTYTQTHMCYCYY